MKKQYVCPKLELELFQLNESIASCETRVLFGPADSVDTCGDFGFKEDDPFKKSNGTMAATGMIYPFYENGSCQCYYNAPRQSGYFSS